MDAEGLKRKGLFLALATVFLLPACRPKEMRSLLEPSQALGAVLADETLRLLGARKQVALITHDSSWGQPSTTEAAFRDALKKHGVTVDSVKAANLGNPMFSGRVGLKSGDFFEVLEKSGQTGAIVSLVGAPLLEEGEISRVRPEHPPVLVVATASLGDKMGVHTDAVQLARLLEAKVIQLAIIDGGDPTATPANAQADPKRELFTQNYRILRRPD